LRIASLALWFVVFSLFSVSSMNAQGPLVTDRPDFTESAAVVGTGRVQLEGGATWTDVGDSDELALGEILVRIGLHDRLEFRVAANSYARVDGPDGDVEGVEDPSLGAKWLLAEGERGSAAFLAGTSIPLGDDDVGAEGWQPELRLALAKDVGDAALGANLGWEWQEASERTHVGLGSVTLGLPLGEWAGVFFETYAFAAEGAGGEEAYFDTGVTRLLSDDFQLDLRVGVGLNDEASDWFAGVGAAHRW
jgi:hypothetical protein